MSGINLSYHVGTTAHKNIEHACHGK